MGEIDVGTILCVRLDSNYWDLNSPLPNYSLKPYIPADKSLQEAMMATMSRPSNRIPDISDCL